MPEWNEAGPEDRIAEGVTDAGRAQISMAEELAKQGAEAKRRHDEGMELRGKEARLAVAKDILCALIRASGDNFDVIDLVPEAVEGADALLTRLAEPKK